MDRRLPAAEVGRPHAVRDEPVHALLQQLDVRMHAIRRRKAEAAARIAIARHAKAHRRRQTRWWRRLRVHVGLSLARAVRVKETLTEAGFASSEPLLDAVFGNSPFLGRLAQRETGALGEYFAADPETVLNAAILLAHAAERAENEVQAMKDLRTAKRRAALGIAMADIAGLWDVNRVTRELTR